MTVQAQDIDQLVKQAQGGDRAAFRALVLALENDLRFFLAAFAVGEGLVQELLQATFVSAYQNLASYRAEGAFLGWLKAIARNHLLRALREQKRYAEVTAQHLDTLVVDAGLDDLERAEELDAQTRRLRRCLERLAPASRALVEGRYAQGQAMAHIAQELRRTEVWVRVTLHRVRQSLRRCMESLDGRVELSAEEAGS